MPNKRSFLPVGEASHRKTPKVMVSRNEARAMSVERSDLFRLFSSEFETAIENGKLSVELSHSDISDESPIAYAFIEHLKDHDYSVDWDRYARSITVSWC